MMDTTQDDPTQPVNDDDEPAPEQADPEADPSAEIPAEPQPAPPPEGEDAYEDGWYQVLKRRAVGSGDRED